MRYLTAVTAALGIVTVLVVGAAVAQRCQMVQCTTAGGITTCICLG